MRKKKLIWIAPLAIAALLLFVAVGGEIVRLLWNWLLPSLFGWRQITFWEALGILVLCRVLFGGVAGRGFARPSMRHRMAERWDAMRPEDRERLRQRMRDRFGCAPATRDEEGPEESSSR